MEQRFLLLPSLSSKLKMAAFFFKRFYHIPISIAFEPPKNAQKQKRGAIDDNNAP